MKKIIITSLLVCISFYKVSAQNIIKLDQFLDSIFKPFNTKNSPGCAITILQNGKPIAKKTYGMASIDTASSVLLN